MRPVRDPGDAGPGDARSGRPTEWVTGEEPMTGPQASYLETLAQQAGDEPPTGLNKSEASRAIDELQAEGGGGDEARLAPGRAAGRARP